MNPDEPPAVPGEPVCPEWLDEVALAEWERVTALLRGQGRLSLDVAPTLVAYCQAYANWREAIERGGRRRLSVLTIARWATMRDRSLGHMTRLLTEMGLTPASKSRVGTSKPAGSRLGEFLRGGRSG